MYNPHPPPPMKFSPSGCPNPKDDDIAASSSQLLQYLFQVVS